MPFIGLWLAQQAQYIHSQNIVIQAVFETKEGGYPTRVKGTIAGDVAQHGVGFARVDTNECRGRRYIQLHQMCEGRASASAKPVGAATTSARGTAPLTEAKAGTGVRCASLLAATCAALGLACRVTVVLAARTAAPSRARPSSLSAPTLSAAASLTRAACSGCGPRFGVGFAVGGELRTWLDGRLVGIEALVDLVQLSHSMSFRIPRRAIGNVAVALTRKQGSIDIRVGGGRVGDPDFAHHDALPVWLGLRKKCHHDLVAIRSRLVGSLLREGQDRGIEVLDHVGGKAVEEARRRSQHGLAHRLDQRDNLRRKGLPLPRAGGLASVVFAVEVLECRAQEDQALFE